MSSNLRASCRNGNDPPSLGAHRSNLAITLSYDVPPETVVSCRPDLGPDRFQRPFRWPSLQMPVTGPSARFHLVMVKRQEIEPFGPHRSAWQSWSCRDATATRAEPASRRPDRGLFRPVSWLNRSRPDDRHSGPAHRGVTRRVARPHRGHATRCWRATAKPGPLRSPRRRVGEHTILQHRDPKP